MKFTLGNYKVYASPIGLFLGPHPSALLSEEYIGWMFTQYPTFGILGAVASSGATGQWMGNVVRRLSL